jgi:hypothetical protein
LPEGLIALGRIDFRQAHLDLKSGAKQDSDCVAVGNANHAAFEIRDREGRDK